MEAALLPVLQQFGPAGIAAVAVWWLTEKHNAAIKSITEAHSHDLLELSNRAKTRNRQLVRVLKELVTLVRDRHPDPKSEPPCDSRD